METYYEILDKICRLCASKIKYQANYRNAKHISEFKIKIKTLFHYDIADDEKSKDPEYLCCNCVKKLRKVDHKKDYQIQSMVLFDNHTIENCLVCSCSLAANNYSVSEIRKFSINHIREAAEKFGFLYVPHLGNHSFVRVRESSNIDLTLVVKQQDQIFLWKLYVYNLEMENNNTHISILPEELKEALGFLSGILSVSRTMLWRK